MYKPIRTNQENEINGKPRIKFCSSIAVTIAIVLAMMLIGLVLKWPIGFTENIPRAEKDYIKTVVEANLKLKGTEGELVEANLKLKGTEDELVEANFKLKGIEAELVEAKLKLKEVEEEKLQAPSSMDAKAYKSLLAYQNSQSTFAEKTGGNGENKWGYYSFEINGMLIPGQRSPDLRINAFKKVYDFNNKTVVNIGANAGIIDFFLAKDENTKWNIGFDFDPTKVNLANNLATSCGVKNLNFYYFDLQEEDLEKMRLFFPEKREKVDVILMLAVNMWINNWADVIKKIKFLAHDLIIEVNGDVENHRKEVVKLLKSECKTLKTITKITGKNCCEHRDLYFCHY